MPTASKDGENEPMGFLQQNLTDKPLGYKPTTRAPLRPVIENNVNHASQQATTETLWKTSVESKSRNRPQDLQKGSGCPEKKKRRQRKEHKDKRKPSLSVQSIRCQDSTDIDRKPNPDANDLDKMIAFEKLSSIAKSNKSPASNNGQADTSYIRSSEHSTKTEDKEEQELVHILETCMLQKDPKTEINTVAEYSIETPPGRRAPGIPMEASVLFSNKDSREDVHNNSFAPIHKEGTPNSSHEAVGLGAHERINTEFQIARPQPFRPTIKEDSNHTSCAYNRAFKDFCVKDATPRIGCNPTSAFVTLPVFEEKIPT
eukprot:scaffold6665_cov53-Attheya_sp.AAC.9